MKCSHLTIAIFGWTLLCSQWLVRIAACAEGYGAGATGGNGYDTYYVTTLSDSGAGSLREALSDAETNGGGIIRFDEAENEVGGVIDLSQSSPLNIPSNVTICGETAVDAEGLPPGITIYGNSTRVGPDADNVIVRHVRFRDKDRNTSENTIDCFEIWRSTNVLVEHCSMAWGNDGTLDIAESTDVTVEYCIIAEALYVDGEEEETGSSKAMLVRAPTDGNGNVTLHHNYFISSKWRNALVSGLGSNWTMFVEFYNNVVYNWGTHGTILEKDPNEAKANIVGNYFDDGPSTTHSGLAIYVRNESVAYVDDNYFEDDADIYWETGSTSASTWLNTNPTMTPDDPLDAYLDVMTTVGPDGPRDQIDERLINELVWNWNGGGSIKTSPPSCDIDYLTGEECE